MKTDQTVGFLNLRDRLTHEKTAITTGMEQCSCRRGGVREGIVDHAFSIFVRIGRMPQTIITTIIVIRILAAIYTFIIGVIVIVGMEIVEAKMIGVIVDIPIAPC